jgi:hypothetical protein
MKNRSRLAIFATIFSVLACIGLAYGVGGPESPDPSPFPVNSNTADGFRALENSANAFNSAFGWFSSFTNTGATFFSTGLGAGTLFFNDAADNTAVGTAAMFFNTSGTDNTAVGINALRDNDSGGLNNAVGAFALFSNVSGVANEAMGNNALTSNTIGGGNVAIGDSALNGADAFFNTAVGLGAGQNVIAGAENIYIGDTAGTLDFTGTPPGDESGVIRIGSFFSGTAACFINGIYLNPNPGLLPVQIDANGQLSTTVSSERFKKDIDPMDKASEAIFSLKPVTFHYKKDKTNTPQFGLIAEEVAKVNPALIAADKEGKPYTVRYEQINAMLLNEFIKEHKKVEEQQASISQLKSEMQTMVAQLKEQAAQIQKVSAQVEMNKPAPQVVANKP